MKGMRSETVASQEPEQALTPNGEPAEAARHRRWLRYFIIYGALWRNSVVREMGFQANFLLWMFVELLWFALQLAFNSVIYLHTDSIGTWTKWEAGEHPVSGIPPARGPERVRQRRFGAGGVALRRP